MGLATWMLEGSGLGSPLPRTLLHRGWGKAPQLVPSLQKRLRRPAKPGSPRGAPALPRGLGFSAQGCANSKGTILEGPAGAQSSPQPPLPCSPPHCESGSRCGTSTKRTVLVTPIPQPRPGSSTSRREPREPGERHSGKCIYSWRMFQFSISVPRTKLRVFHPNAMAFAGHGRPASPRGEPPGPVMPVAPSCFSFSPL